MSCSLIMWSVHAVTPPLALLSLVILQLRFRRSTVTPGGVVKAPAGKPWCASWYNCAFHVNRTKQISQWMLLWLSISVYSLSLNSSLHGEPSLCSSVQSFLSICVLHWINRSDAVVNMCMRFLEEAGFH